MSNYASQNMSKILIQATFIDMGLRVKTGLAEHLHVNNAYENNLLSDISKVDYLVRNQGRTRLRSLVELPVFVDDMYIIVDLKFRGHGFSRKHLLYDRIGWTRTERRGKDTNSSSRHPRHKTEHRGAYPTHTAI